MERFKLLSGDEVMIGVTQLREAVKAGIRESCQNLGEFDLSRLHEHIPIESVNSVRLTAFKSLNKPYDRLDKVVKQIAGQTLLDILGPDLLIQTKLNLSVQLPHDNTSQLDLHSDCWAGDTPFQVNLWIPLTDCFATNSMFILSPEESLRALGELNKNDLLEKQELQKLISPSHFIALKFGNAIVFNPGLIHGNVVNRTQSTRVSVNIRFKGLFSPDAGQTHVSRSAGVYYRLFNISNWTKLAIDLDNQNHNLHISAK